MQRDENTVNRSVAGCGKGSLTAITKVFWSVTDRFEVYNYAGSESQYLFKSELTAKTRLNNAPSDAVNEPLSPAH